MGTPGTDPYRVFFDLPGKIQEIRIFQKNIFQKIKFMFILRNPQWEGSFPVRMELPGGGGSQWGESFPVVRDLPSGNGAS